MDKPMNTKYVFEFEDGTSCEMTLTFYVLYLLRAKNKALYAQYNKTMSVMAEEKYEYDELDSLIILYTAYVCANINEPEETIMSKEEFFIKCGSDRVAVSNAVVALTNPKKAKATVKPSEEKQENEKTEK